MAVTLNADQVRVINPSPVVSDSSPDESWLHMAAREFRSVLRWTVIISAIATVVTMATVFYWAFFPAVVLLGSYCMLIFANELEARSHGPHEEELGLENVLAQAQAEAQSTDPVVVEKRVVDRAVDSNMTANVLKIVIGLAVLGSIIAAVIAFNQGFTDWRAMAVAGIIVCAYLLLLGWPTWVASIEDEAEFEQERVEHELHPGEEKAGTPIA